MAICDINGKNIATGGIVDGSVTPEKTSFMGYQEELVKSPFTDLLSGNTWAYTTEEQQANGLPASQITHAKPVYLEAGTYYLYDVNKLSASAYPGVYAQAEDSAFYRLGEDSVTVTRNGGNWPNGTYDEYNNENTSKFQPDGVVYMVEYTIVLAVAATVHFTVTNASRMFEVPGYTWLSALQYNPLKNERYDVTIRRLYANAENADAFAEAILLNPVMAKRMGYALPNAYGKNWYHIGDSNSQWMGGEKLDNPDDSGFLLTAARKNGVAKLTNASHAGAAWGMRDDDTDAYCAIARVDELVASGETPDIITFLMGTNSDAGLGSADDAIDNKHTTHSAVRYCLAKCLAAFPRAAIGVMLPMQRAESYETQEQVNEVILDACRFYGIPTLDLFHEGQVVPDSKLTAYDDGHTGVLYVDSAHITGNGVAQLGRKISGWLNLI
jgi:lysophospholipase L1-like esterase